MYKKERSQTLACKVLILGESNVGKTSIISRFLSNDFDYNKYSMSGAYKTNKTMFLKNKNSNKIINFEIWDTPGQKKFRILHRVLYNNVNVFILVYDITNCSSFDELKNYWINEIKTNVLNSSSILLIILNYFLYF